MKVDGKQLRPIWLDTDLRTVKVIDQRLLPHRLEILELTTVEQVVDAIRQMVVRGAPLIGVTGAYGVLVALLTAADEAQFQRSCARIRNARPTAVNLAWAVDRVLNVVGKADSFEARAKIVRREASLIAEQEVDHCRRIGEHGARIIAQISRAKGRRTVNLLTHCNAGWLACVEWGTATAPMYVAHEMGIDLHVWVDETRPLNQGARLTAWELGKAGIAHTVITDNAGGHLMQRGRVDLVVVGTDRTTHTGDVANKIGTYLKALAARDNQIPFYVALPSSTFDWHARNGLEEIAIEDRHADEVRFVQGETRGAIQNVLVPPADSPASNPAFDITPARLVTGFITERGICEASEAAIAELFPEKGPPGTGLLTELEKQVIAAIQGDLPIVERPYEAIAAQLGVSENDLLDIMRSLVQRGIIRRFGATLRHQKSGFRSNVMVAWKVDPGRVDEVGKIMAGFRSVSHCYHRNATQQWPYNLYTMVHGKDEPACRQTARKMAAKAGVQDYALLFSRRELKKTSMKYFQ
jgi:methylthioribose-1-phosphate isomerase